jgi:hypothetical protein
LNFEGKIEKKILISKLVKAIKRMRIKFNKKKTLGG